MARRRLRIAILIALGLAAISAVVWWRREPLVKAYIAHRVAIATIDLPACDAADVCRLDIARNDTGGFPLRSENRVVAILGQSRLTGNEAEALARLWRAQSFDFKFQALCHNPGFGVRFAHGSGVVLETTICFHCSDFCIDTPFGPLIWGFDTSTPQAAALLERLDAIVPAPAKASAQP